MQLGMQWIENGQFLQVSKNITTSDDQKDVNQILKQESADEKRIEANIKNQNKYKFSDPAKLPKHNWLDMTYENTFESDPIDTNEAHWPDVELVDSTKKS